MNDYIPTKVCTKCKTELHATSEFFYAHKEGKYGLRPDCKACVIKKTSEWHSNNPEKTVKIKQRWAKNNHEKKLESQRRWRENHPDKVREVSKRYYNANLEKQRIIRSNRRARKAAAEGSHTVADMRRQYKAQKGKCWWCSKKVTWEDHHNDHLIPLSRGGTNWPNNMVITCVHCNLSKNDRLPHEWSGRLF